MMTWMTDKLCTVCAGYLISLKVPELALAVELCLKGLLQAFTCDNHNDERVLKGIMSKVFPSGQRPQIITSPFLPSVHDTRRRWVWVTLWLTFSDGVSHWAKGPFNSSSFTWFILESLFCYGRAVDHPDYQSVLQVLEIEDPVVANCLIDLRGIESILLFMVRPAHCISAFTWTWNVYLSRNPVLFCALLPVESNRGSQSDAGSQPSTQLFLCLFKGGRSGLH